ncbi:hydroxycinnamoyl shikimate quinate hydroxycinnamoyltransferase [Fusarium longipes]|uniref:Hydroxycinnamoyl shikimate quinate hydroxycinnamoyltransferase n=1 Tax=Fusarium longipes TaxID=694270 RepID=A0A395T3M3_9HYPO|nr:hydroxycinnamoyl shikimate quinate hydroxycinnamoyltransferase [Fusarium longipes]
MAQRIDIQHDDQGVGDRDFPLSFLDTYFMPVDVILVINESLDQDRLCKSLSKALSLYPPVFGRFRRPSIATQGELSLHLYHSIPLFWRTECKEVFSPSSWKEFIDRITTKKVLAGQAPLLQVTVTYLPDTRQTVLGVSFCHVLGDALSLYSLLRTWSSIYAQDNASIPPPITERIRFKNSFRSISAKEIPRQLPRRSQRFSPTFSSKINAYAPLVHTIVFKTLEYARLGVTTEHLGILVKKTRARLHPATCSTQDAFKAYLLKALNRFVYKRLTPYPRVTRIVTIVDARRPRNVPQEYFGNCITAADTTYLPASKSLSQVALAVREGVNSLTPEKMAKGDEWIQAIQSVNGLMDLTPAFEADTLYVDDWTKVAMEEVNFGQQQETFCQPLEVEALPIRNWCMIYKANAQDHTGGRGGLGYQVQVSVPKGMASELVEGIEMDLQEEFSEYFW